MATRFHWIQLILKICDFFIFDRHSLSWINFLILTRGAITACISDLLYWKLRHWNIAHLMIRFCWISSRSPKTDSLFTFSRPLAQYLLLLQHHLIYFFFWLILDINILVNIGVYKTYLFKNRILIKRPFSGHIWFSLVC